MRKQRLEYEGKDSRFLPLHKNRRSYVFLPADELHLALYTEPYIDYGFLQLPVFLRELLGEVSIITGGFYCQPEKVIKPKVLFISRWDILHPSDLDVRVIIRGPRLFTVAYRGSHESVDISFPLDLTDTSHMYLTTSSYQVQMGTLEKLKIYANHVWDHLESRKY